MLDNNAIIKLYESGKSPYEIAELYDTYPNKIRRILKKFVTLRDKSSAQKLGIQTGRIPHPTKGKTINQATKAKIGQSVHNYWKNLSEDELKKKVEASKERWKNIPLNDRKDMQEKAWAAIRKAAKEGSKLEKHIHDVLVSAQFDVQFHRKNLVINTKLEADIFLPEINTIIEIDGPSHFLPIWGEDKLKQTIKSDTEKVGLAINKGFVVVRVKCLADILGERHRQEATRLILETVNKIKQKMPPKKKRLIELEIGE